MMPPSKATGALGSLPPITLSEPNLSGREWELVKDCLDSGWVSSAGPYVDRFEQAVARLAECEHGIALVNGSAALHMALLCVGVVPGDEVVLPAITFVASANAVRHCGAHPIVIDIEPDHLQLDVSKLSTFLANRCTRLPSGELVNRVTGRRVKAVMPVHLLGHPVAMTELLEVTTEYGLEVVEDAAQALGSRYRERPVGGLGRCGCFSFNGNKIVTAAGGGVLVTDDQALARRARHLSTQATVPGPAPTHDEVGYNYRLTSLHAALGCAQLEALPERIDHRRAIAGMYAEQLADEPGLAVLGEAPGIISNCWLPTVRIEPEIFGCDAHGLREALAAQDIASRLLYQPLHRSPSLGAGLALSTDVADRLHPRVLCLPASLPQGQQDLSRVVAAISAAGQQARARSSAPVAKVSTRTKDSDQDALPALLGGRPIRSEPFAPSVWLDSAERAAVLEAFDRHEFSRYAGGPVPGVETHLRLTSDQAVDFPLPYWNVLGGMQVRQLERNVARSTQVPFAVAVNSATTGLVAALQAAGVGPGDEVITTPVTFTATATSIVLANAVPIFADIDEATGNLDPAAVAARISPRTRAILLVHLLGRPANLDAFCQLAADHNLALIEDCAQAPGATYRDRPVGSFGRFGVYSLQQTKNVMAGEGGLVVAKCPEDARRLRLARNHGEAIVEDGLEGSEVANTFGSNYRMNELTAALARAQWQRLGDSNAARSRNAATLWARLRGLPGLSQPTLPSHAGAVPHVLALRYDAKAAGVPKSLLLDALRAEGIPVGGGYPRPLYMHPMFQSGLAYGDAGCPFRCPLYGGTTDYRKGSCPEAERFLANALWVFQIYPPLAERDMDDIARAFERVWQARDRLRATGLDGGESHIDR
ncbi:MAG: aminotransferase class I/II-fold pyridoxal phosphate-dependent enzyme [Myxococcales bacterium]|nr:aminotransferase class I/II-fold pyridoxal phosphate-dependent enzyme [Myxococcales bacterium]